jgi:hypothetical protein
MKSSVVPKLLIFLLAGTCCSKLGAQGPPIVSPLSLEFGSQVAATTSSAQPITITSHYLAGLSVTSIAVTGNFTETDNCVPPPPAVNNIAMGKSCVILVAYTPTAAAPDIGQLTITFSVGTPQVVNLSGTGTASGVTLSPSSLVFGSQELQALGYIGPQNSTSTAQVVTLTNTGAAPLPIANVVATGDFFESDDCALNYPLVTQIQPGFSCIILVNFAPTVATGTRTGKVTITDSSNNNYVITLTGFLTGFGAGTTGLRLLGSSLTFGSQAVGTTSVGQVVTITASGPFLQITDVSITGDFAITNNNCVGITLHTGTSCEILMTFAPTQTGIRTGQITLTDIASADSGNYVPNVVTLIGSGTSGGVSLSSSSLSFGTQPLGIDGPPQSVVLTNTGNTDLLIHQIDSIDDAIITEQDNCSPLPPATANTLHPGDSCTIQVTMDPQSFGRMLAGKVIVSDSDPDSPHYVALAGPGSGDSLTVSPSLLGGSASVTVNDGFGSPLISKVAAIGPFTETDNCVPTAVTCVINVGFPAPPATTQIGQITVDDPNHLIVSPVIVALSTAGPSTPLVPTTTSLVGSPNPSVFGQPLVLTATVSVTPPATGTPTGAVIFLDGSTTLGTVTLTAGQATLNTPALISGAHSITAFYSGAGNFLGSVSAPVTQTVNVASTATSLTASPSTTSFGQAVTLTATITEMAPGVGTPMGTVTFFDGPTNLGSALALSGGSAQLTTSTLTVGSHSLTAVYSGDPNNSASTSTAVTETVITQVSSSTLLSTSAATIQFGQSVTFTAAVTGASPTGTVQFMDGATNLGVAAALSGGSAQVTTSALPVGTHSITGVYSGDTNNSASTSSVLSETVTQAAATVTLSNLTQTYTGSVLTPTVTTVPANLAIAWAGAPDTAAGTYTVTATVTDPNYTGSASGSFVVNKATPTIAWATPAAITYGALLSSIQLNATASVPGTFVYSPSAGTLPSAGNQTLSATFTPTDATNYATATATVTLVVNKATPTITWGTPTAINYGTALSSAQLNATASVLGTFLYSPPAGTVLTPGSQPLSVTFTPTDGTDYNTATASLTLMVLNSPVIISVNEAIHVSDGASFPDVANAEQIKVTDQVSIQVLNATTTSSSVSGGTVYGTAATATVSVSSSTAAVTGSVTLSVDSGAPSVMALSGGSATFNLGVLTAGNHTLVASFSAQGSFVGSSVQTVFTVSKATAVITWATPVPITYGTTLTSTQLNATASVPGTFVYTPPAGTVLSAGSHTLSVTLTPADANDYTTATATVTLVDDKLTPTITWATPAAITYGTALSGTQLNAAASVAGNFVYSPAAGTVLSTGTHTLSMTFNPTDATDYAMVTATVTLIVNVPLNQPPVFTSPSAATFTVGMAGSFAVTATGVPEPTLSLSGTLPAGLNFNTATGILSGTPGAGTGGSYSSIQFVAQNGVAPIGFQNFALTVNEAPSITSSSTITFVAGIPGNFHVSATGFPAPTFAEAGLLPQGLIFLNGILAGIPIPGSEGAYNLTITASNGIGSDSVQNATIQVDPQSLPAFTSASATVFAVASQGATGGYLALSNTFTVKATGAPVPAITHVNNLPSGVGLQDNHDGTATLFTQGGNSVAPPGIYQITLQATGVGGNAFAATQVFTLVVVPISINGQKFLLTPAFSSASEAGFVFGQPNSFTVAASPFIDTITAVGVPLGLTFTDHHNGTGTLSGSPQVNFGQVAITFTASNSGFPAYKVTQTFSLALLAFGSIPAFTSPSVATFAVVPQSPSGYSALSNTFTVKTTGVPVPAITHVNNLPSGVGLQDNHDGTATLFTQGGNKSVASPGVYNITLQATGAGGSAFAATQVFTLIIVGIDPKISTGLHPAFSSASEAGFVFGQPNSFTVAASPFIDTITAVGVPLGLTFTDHHNGTGTLSGSPQVNFGQVAITFTASNSGFPAYRVMQTFSLLFLP